jgi:2-polyprenyl-3-methyl-5-hydroxy-6-metoxy-1,4-benzoquinol methylase
MSVIIHHTSCPCCKSEKINEVLVAKDYTVSKEDFSIWECVNCTVRFTQNIPDAASIAPYYQSSAYVSHTDTKEGLVNQLYHIVRNFTLKTKRNLLQQQTGLQQGNLLDIGAGTGAFAQTMKEAGWQITGLEPDASARTIAKQKFGLVLQMPNELYTLPQAQFDAITMWHVLEHVHDLHSYLEQFNVVLKPQGKIFIAVPNYTSCDASSYKKNWAAYDVPRHLYHFSPKSIDILAALKGFTVKAYKPMWFDSFYVSMLSEQCKNGSGNLVMAFLNGLLSNLQALFNVKKCSSVIYVLSKK